MKISKNNDINYRAIILILLSLICASAMVSAEIFNDSSMLLAQELPADMNILTADQVLIEPDFESVMMTSSIAVEATNSLTITGLTPSTYVLTTLNKSAKYYADRDYVITSVLPLSLDTYKAIKTRNDLLSQTNFTANLNVRIYLAWDMREAIPTGWTKSTSRINVSDPAVSNGGYLQLIYKEYNAGKIVIPKKSIKSNYIIFVVPKTIQYCQANETSSRPGPGKSCCWKGGEIKSNIIIPGQAYNRYLCYNGQIYIHDGNTTSAIIKVQSCTIKGNFYANPNYPWNATKLESNGGWKSGNGAGVPCNNNKVCNNGQCVSNYVACLADIDCEDNNVQTKDKCVKAATTASYCTHNLGGVSVIDHKVYVINYIGDVHPDEDADWLYFYTKLNDFNVNNNIPVSYSFYPGDLDRDRRDFMVIFDKMYSSPIVEFIPKSYDGSDSEFNFDEMSLAQQKELLNKGLKKFNETIKAEFQTTTVNRPVTFDLLGGRFNALGKTALEQTGYKTYFDVYYGDGLGPVLSSSKVDVIQYGLSFTEDGTPGPETTFISKDEMLHQINDFGTPNNDAYLIKINGAPVIPLYCHTQDFGLKNDQTTLNQYKWNVYHDTIVALNNDPNVVMINSKDIYRVRHTG